MVSTEHWHKRVIGHLFLEWLACNLKPHPCLLCASPKATPSAPASSEQLFMFVTVRPSSRPGTLQHRETGLWHWTGCARKAATWPAHQSLSPFLPPTVHLSSSPACAVL